MGRVLGAARRCAEEFWRQQAEGWDTEISAFLAGVPAGLRNECSKLIAAAVPDPPAQSAVRSMAEEFESIAVEQAGDSAFMRVSDARPEGLRSTAEEFLDPLMNEPRGARQRAKVRNRRSQNIVTKP